MKKNYFPFLQFILLTFLTGISYGQTIDVAGPGTFTVPPNAVSATVQIWGAGGAGGGSTSNGRGGAGGGGGGYSTKIFTVVTGQIITYTVGTGGTGNKTDGNNGSDTKLSHSNSGTVMTANGGQGGKANNNGANGGGGDGGTAIGGTSNNKGQNGGNGAGSSAGNGGNGASPGGGFGGAGNNNNHGSIGSPPGGAGGGGRKAYWYSSERNGGNGANGRVIITYTIVEDPTITNLTIDETVCGGDTVIIEGTNFTATSQVKFNGVTATYVFNSATKLTATAPDVASSISGPVTVTTVASTATSSGILTVNATSNAPTGINVAGGKTNVCLGTTPITLTLNGGRAGTGATAEWFTGSCGGTSIGTGNSISPLIASTTTFFVRYEGDCNTTACASVEIIVDNEITGGIISGMDTVCQGDSSVTYTLTGMTNETSYLWTVPPGATITSGSFTNEITVDYGAAAISGDVTIKASNTCGDKTIVYPVNVNEAPLLNLTSMTATENQILCIDSPLTAITYEISGGATGANVTELPAGVTGTYSSGVFTISGIPTEANTFTYTVTTEGDSCGNLTASGTIQVDAKPTLALSSAVGTDNQELCIFTPITDITYSVGGAATFATVDTLPAGLTGSYNSGTYTITGTPTEAGTFNYTITTSGSSCTPASVTRTINVNPLPADAGSITGPPAVCQGQSGVTYTVPAIADATGYIWSLPSGAHIVVGANTNTIVVDFDVDAESGIITVQGSNACDVGLISANFNVTVNITPYIVTNFSVSSCSGDEAIITPITQGDDIVPPGTTYSWGLPSVTGGITGATALSGQTNFNQTLVNPTNTPQTASYLVTATTAGCSASTFSVVVTVNPKPVGEASPQTQIICPNIPIAPISFSETSGISGTIDYSWTRDNTGTVGGSIGASGFGGISGTLTNSTNAPILVTFTVIGKTEYGCNSEPFTVTVSVDPNPTVAVLPKNQTACSGEAIVDIIPSNPNNVPGTMTYSWTRTNSTNITGIPDGNGTSITGALINLTSAPQTTIFTITAYANGCATSTTTTASVTVNPEPTVAVDVPTQTVCSDAPFAKITANNPNSVSGVTYSWTRDNTTNLTGVANSGTGASISGTFVNNTGENQTATFTILATSRGCVSEPTTATVVVTPSPQVVATPAAQTLCTGTNITEIILSNTHDVPGTTYTWIRNNNTNVTGIPNNGTGSSISGNLINNRTTTQTVTFTITATADGCSKTTTATVTIYSPLKTPVIGDSQDVCNSQTPSDLFITSGNLGGSNVYNYKWERSVDNGVNWASAPGAFTNATYSPTNEGYYRLILTDANCGTVVTSNFVVINFIGLGGIFDSISATNVPGIVCSGTSINPGVVIDHSTGSDVTFTYSSSSSFITPSTGVITNTTVDELRILGFHYADRTRANIPLTVQNSTQETVTTILYVSPIFNNGFGTCTADAIAIPITIRPNPTASATVLNSTFCPGTSAGIQVTGDITDASMQFSWTRSTAPGVTGPTSGTSSDISFGSIYTIDNVLNNSSADPQTITYTITPKSNGCSGTLETIDVIIAPNIDPGSIANSQTICNGTTPDGLTQATPASGSLLSYQWQISTTSGTTGFNDISGAHGEDYAIPGFLTEDTWYRRIAISKVNGVDCDSAPSNAVKITINNITAGTTSGDQTVCSGGNPGNITNSIAATGLGTRSYQWQFNTVGCSEADSSWTDIVGANAANYDPDAGLLVTTYYRRVATFASGGCSIASDCVTVFVNDVTGGTIGGDQTICDTNPGPLTEVTPSTGSGLLKYQWKLSTISNSGPWTTITGATSKTYDPPAVPGVTPVTYYIRETISSLNGKECIEESSNVVTVTPSELKAGTIAGGNRTVCYDDVPSDLITGTAASPLSGGLSYQWQASSDAAGPWADILGAIDETYTFTEGIINTTYYRRMVTSDAGCTAYSNSIVVFVNDITLTPLDEDQNICSTEDLSGFTVTATANGTLSYQWESSTTNAPYNWSPIYLATNATYDPPILSENTYYRVHVFSTLNGIKCSKTSDIITIGVSTYIAPVAEVLTPVICGVNTINLIGNHTGFWSAVSVPAGGTYSFSASNNRETSFTGETGYTYNIIWTIDNPADCSGEEAEALVSVKLETCGDNIDFNGTDNYTNFKDEFNFTSDFSIELWIKRSTAAIGKQTLFSKRDVDNTSSSATGYDFSLEDSKLTFNWNGAGKIQAPQTLDESRWYHVAVIYDGNYKLYIDGIEVTSTAGSGPNSNTFNSLLGAIGSATGVPQHYYHGSVDELRIWNTALSEAQIREMMNQEIEANVTAVRGSMIGLDIAGLVWTDLAGYYRMNQGTADISAGQLADNSGLGHFGTLTNMISNQLESAPLPYISAGNGNWTSPATWSNGTVQQIPNSLGIDGITFIDWNIVRTEHDVISDSKDVIVLGLLVDSNKLTITAPGAQNEIIPGTGLWVTHYLKLDGTLDLVGESQLLQPEGSIVDHNGTGILEKDQQGTGNWFNYNYWGSPVHSPGTLPTAYRLVDLLYDGTSKVNWTNDHTPNTVTTPVTLSTRWLHIYDNNPEGVYTGWQRVSENTAIPIGLGFTMKGGNGGVNASDINYTFRGQPNNGSILIPIDSDYKATVVGNPYPSAIDANKFIDDNEGVLETGSALLFWQQSPTNGTHILSQYQGGYGQYTKIGGLLPVSPPEIAGLGTANPMPTRYIPVGQGFFVNSGLNGGDIKFNNSQRLFRKEGTESIFLRGSKNTQDHNHNSDPEDKIQRVRIIFKNPEGAIRNLLLGFTPDNAATDGIDYGYDGLNADAFPSDLSFRIGEKEFVIQGVGAFDDTKQYPLEVKLARSGPIEIGLSDLENFENPIDVYVYDKLLDTYTLINNTKFQINLEAGVYKERFYIAFKPDNTLDIIDQDFKDIHVKYLQKTDEIYVKTPASIEVRQLYLINMAGQAVKSWNMTNMNFGQEFKIPVKDIAEGNYILKVETNTNSYNKKLIVKF